MKTKIKNHVLIAFVALALGAGVGATAALQNGAVKADAETETTAFANGMCFKTGAAVRTDADSMGIRFEAYFNADIYASVEAGTGAAGMIVVPAKAIEGVSDDYFEHLYDVHGKSANEISTTFKLSQFTAEDYNADEAMDYLAKGAIVNVKDANLTLEYQAVAFYKANDGDYVYSGKSDVRTISKVTDIALKSDRLTDDMRVDTLEMATGLSARLEGLNKSAESDFTLETTVENGIDLTKYQSTAKTVASATLDGEAVTVAENKIALTAENAKASAQALKLTYSDESTLVINVTVRNYVTVAVAGTQKHELYSGLNAGERVANAALTFNAGAEIPANLTWKVGEKDVTANVTVNGSTVTLDAAKAGLYGGEYTLVGQGENDGTVTTVNAKVLLVNKIITTPEDLIAWEQYLDVTKTGTVSDVTYKRTEGYLELGANIYLGTNALAYEITVPQDAAMAEYGFNGTFDGNGYTLVNGCYGARGMFGLVGSDGVIKNVAFTDTTVTENGANVIAEIFYGELTNVLVDASTYGTGVVYQQGVAGFLLGAKLTNVIAYSSSTIGSYGGANMALAQYAPSAGYGSTGATTFNNVWVFTLTTDGAGYGIGAWLGGAAPTANNIKVNTYSTASSVVTGMPDMFNLKLGKAYFADYAKTLADFDDEIASIPTSLEEGAIVTLPTIPNANYTLAETTAATLSGNVLTVSNTLEANATITLTVDLSAYGVENETVEISIKNVNFIEVQGVKKHELYAGLNAGERVANAALSFNAGAEVPANLTWKANGVDVTANVTVNGSTVTLDAVAAGLYGGEYTIVGQGENDGTVTTVNAKILLVNKIITTAEDLIAWASYGDKTNVATFERTVTLSNSKTGAANSTKTYNQAYTVNGYFELGGNIDLTGKDVNAFVYFTADTGSGVSTAYGLKGTFDGKGYTVYGGTYYEGGLFGAVANGSTVKNLALTNITMNSTTSDYYVGVRPSAFAETVSGTISNVLVDVIGYGWPHCQVATGFSYNLIDATLQNVVVYYPFIQEASAIISYGGSNVSISNVYAIGCDNDYRFQAWGYIPGAANPTTIKLSQVNMATSFTGLDASLWNLNLDKVYFNSYTKTLADFDDEIASIPTSLEEGATVTLPTIPNASYTLSETTAATLSGNVLTVSSTLEQDATITLIVDLSAYGAENETVEISIKNLNIVVIEGVQEYEVYPTLNDEGVKVQNATPFTVNVGAGVPDEGMTWTATDSDNVSKDVSAYVSVLDGVVTINPALRGEYKIVGKTADESVNVEMHVLIVNKFISEATQLQNIKAYGDISDERTYKNAPQYKFDGYFVLTKNLDMTGLTMTVSFTSDIADVPTNKQNEYGFIGTLDGDGYTVSGGTYSTGGLFGSVGSEGVIKNIAFVNANLAYNSNVIASIFYGTLENVLIDFTLDSIGKGVAQWILNATMKNVVIYAPSNATGGDQFTYAAFIPFKHSDYGNMDPSTFTNCYSFTNNTTGSTGIDCAMFGQDANNIKNIKKYNLSQNASVITGMDTTLWNLTGAKATFVAKANKA